MLEKIIRFVVGTAEVTICGKNNDKILSFIVKSEAVVKKIEKKQNDEIKFLCYKRSLKKIKEILDDKQIDYTVKYHGLPVAVLKYRLRWGIPVGIILFLISFYTISMFVWEIQVVGCEKTSSNEVLIQLEKNGFSIGSNKKEIDISKIENLFLYNNDDFSWISINVKGTTAFVEIRETVRKVKKLDTSKPSNIYASRDGVIASVNAYMGYNVVKIGDTVTAGDLIVSGEYTDKYGKEYKLHSYATVMAYTTRTHTVTVPYKYFEHQSTGKYKNYYKINLRRFSLPLYFKENISYNTYSKNHSVKVLKMSDHLALPFSLEKTSYRETVVVECFRSKEAAIADAYEQLYDFEYNLIGIDILNRTYDVSEDENGVTVKVTLDCYEDIGTEKEIT